jgi:acetolactate synthase-1/2/3 large subunit
VADAVARLAAGHDLPVLTTYKARGVVDDRGPNAAGVATGATAESPLLDACDLVIGVGLDPVELIPAPWPYSAPVVLLGSWPIDDSTYFGDRLAAEVVGDLATLVATLDGLVESTWSPGEAQGYRLLATEAMDVAVPVDPMGLTPQQVVTIAREVAPVGTVATVDAGAHMLAAVPLWEVSAPGELLISNGLATMGFALPAAIAAALVDPARPVVCFTGDGGLGINLAELETVARLGLAVTVVVFNDAALSLIAIKQSPDGQGGPDAVSYLPTDFAAVGAGFGIHGERVSDASSYHAALKTALSRPGPSLLDVTVDPSTYAEILAAIRGRS